MDFEQISHFVTSYLGIVTSLLIIAFVVWILRHVGYTGPIEFSEFVERIFRMFLRTDSEAKDADVNVALLDADGASMVFGPFIAVAMHNGHGKKYWLNGGTFDGCNPKWIKAGASVDVSYQDSLLIEKLRVKLNHTEQHLYLQSRYSLTEILQKIA